MTSMEPVQPFRASLASDWQSSLERDEWFFSRLREDLVTQLSSSEAFAAMDAVAELTQQQTEPFLQ
jgi:hypothetical protein